VLSNPRDFLWTDLDSLGQWIVVGIYYFGTFVLNLYSLVRLNNIVRAIWATRFFRAKPKAGGVIPEGEEPVVTLQICCYNERNVITNTINAACAVDWPRSKLFVQVLDDSTDESIEVIEQTCAKLRELGFNCQRLSRADRIGYKAGNLQAHFDEIQGDFVGLFDSDHMCEGDFLRRCMPHFFDAKGNQKRKVGLVQCPWGYYNIHTNLLTEYDSLNLDTAFVIEQTAREAFVGAFGFNGTGHVEETGDCGRRWLELGNCHGGSLYLVSGRDSGIQVCLPARPSASTGGPSKHANALAPEEQMD